MLIIWDTLLLPELRLELQGIDPRAHYWPRTNYQRVLWPELDPADWYISFSSGAQGIQWVLRYGEHSHIIYTDGFR